MTCDEYQIAFDQLAAGATPSVTRDEVDAHIAGCAACSAYVAMSRKVTDSMMTTISASPPAPALDAMHKLLEMRRNTTRARFVGPVLFGVMMLAINLFIDRTGTVLGAVISSLFSGALFYAAWGWLTNRHLTKLGKINTSSRDELVVGVRAELDRQLRNERQTWWLLPALLVLFHWQFAGWARPSAAVLLVELLLIATVARSIVRYHRAKRERALLG
jgi:hypothetical protein